MKRTPKTVAQRSADNCKPADGPGWRIVVGFKAGARQPVVLLANPFYGRDYLPAAHATLPRRIREAAAVVVGEVNRLRPASGDLRAWAVEVHAFGLDIMREYRAAYVSTAFAA